MTDSLPDGNALLDAIRRHLALALPDLSDPAATVVHEDPKRAEPAWNLAELERFRRLQHDYPQRTGKYLRGQVVALSAAAHGAAGAGVGSAVLDVAAALELFQAWVLVHDDIEDDSETRRGLPALHRQVGMPIALNVGDAMHVRMWRLLQGLAAADKQRVRSIIDEFSEMIERTAEGQHLDLAYLQTGRVEVSEAEYLDMVSRKTAYYTVVSPLRLGALLAGSRPAPAFTDAGIDLGIAFQIRDDVLNLRRPAVAVAARGSGAAGDGNSGGGNANSANGNADYGKEFAGDLYEGKRTLILAHTLACADPAERRRAVELLLRPRQERGSAEVAELLTLIESQGSLEYAQQVASQRAARGLASLATALAELPGRAAAEELLELLSSVAKRDH